MSDQGPISEINAHSAEKQIKLSQQFQKTQADLAQKNAEQQKIENKTVKAPDFQDKVEIKSLFNWQQTKAGEFEIKLENKLKSFSAEKDMKYSGEKILRLLGYKIDFTEKLESLKENYMRLFIETKSPNLLLAKFSQVKFGMFSILLSVLGISTPELQKLQKQALGNSIEENIKLFEQNEYNIEMLNIFGDPKKDKSKKKVLNELHSQLSNQMARLGKKDFYNEEKITSIKKEQVTKIKQDLLQEKENLEYLSEYQT